MSDPTFYNWQVEKELASVLLLEHMHMQAGREPKPDEFLREYQRRRLDASRVIADERAATRAQKEAA